jgi:predicted kinase
MNSKEIILLVGLPGSGKSTWVKKFILDNPDYIVVSTDDIIENYAKSVGKTYSEVFDEYMSNAEVEYNIKLATNLREGKSIIVDRTNLYVKSRRKILSKVPKDYRKISIIFNTHIDEIQKRLAVREKSTGKIIPDYIFSSMTKGYQEPVLSEGFDDIQRI